MRENPEDKTKYELLSVFLKISSISYILRLPFPSKFKEFVNAILGEEKLLRNNFYGIMNKL